MRTRSLMLGLLALFATPFVQAQNCPGVAPWSFVDVTASDPFCASITFMATSGVTLGCQIIDANNRLYCPNAFVTRTQMAGFMDRLADNAVFAKGGNAFGGIAVLGTTDNYGLDIRVNGNRAMRYHPNAISPNVIGGHAANSIGAGVRGATIAGGGVPTNGDPDFAGADPNRVAGSYGTVGGGFGNLAGNDAGGALNSTFATVAGGLRNTAGNVGSTVSGGSANTASGDSSTVTGGAFNSAIGTQSTVAGGFFNTASGAWSFAAGTHARANGANCAVFSLWGSSPGMPCFGNASQFFIGALHGMSIDYHSQRADGGGDRFVYIGNNFPPYTITTWTGATLTDGGVWTNASDATRKDAFAEIDNRAILETLAALPIRSWRYKVEPDDVRHIGPTAQDFKAAFALGHDEKSIATVDADGVALAAIQGLNAKVDALVATKDAQIAALRREMSDLRASHLKEIADLRLAIELLMARETADVRVAHKR